MVQARGGCRAALRVSALFVLGGLRPARVIAIVGSRLVVILAVAIAVLAALRALVTHAHRPFGRDGSQVSIGTGHGCGSTGAGGGSSFFGFGCHEQNGQIPQGSWLSQLQPYEAEGCCSGFQSMPGRPMAKTAAARTNE